MADQEQLAILKQGVEVWNQWRKEHANIRPDLRDVTLRGADLHGADLSGAALDGADLTEGAPGRGTNLSGANLSGADLSRAFFYNADLTFADLSYATLIGTDLSEANLFKANLSSAYLRDAILHNASLNGANLSFAHVYSANLYSVSLYGANLSSAHLDGAYLTLARLIGANLSDADLHGANLSSADLGGANLSGANLSGANLSRANLSSAKLHGADLSEAILVQTYMKQTSLIDCNVYGISVWDIKLENTIQLNLVITPKYQSTITTDNLKIAQFIYLLLNNTEIREIIDTVAKKAVLILGRFTPERKAILDALREALRTNGYVPILFDFDKPSSRDLTETISILAHLSRFIIVDLTDPSSAPHEVATIIPQTVVPIQPLLTLQPLIVDGKAIERHEYAMFDDLRRRYHWVLPTFRYQDTANLLASLQKNIIKPAEQKAKELAKR